METACHCSARTDCLAADPTSKWACTPGHRCVRICASASDCENANAGVPICEYLLCRPQGCGDDVECIAGLSCRDGTCQAPIAPSEVASCEVQPALAVLNAGGTAAFRVIARDADGKPLTYAGAVQWSSLGFGAHTSNTGVDAVFSAFASLQRRTDRITASIGNVTCSGADVKEYEAATKLRVVVISALETPTLAENAPLRGATVLLDDGSTATTDTSGVASFPAAAAGPHTVSVFADGYDYTTVVATRSIDLLIPLQPSASDVTLTGQFKDTDFLLVDSPLGTMRWAFAGGSFAGNLFDLAPNTLVGKETKPTMISLGTGGAYGPFPMPAGFVMGLGAQMYGPPEPSGGGYSVVTKPGLRATWALGGNSTVGDVVKILGPTLFGGSSSQPPIMAVWTEMVLGFLQNADSGLVPYVPVAPGTTASLGSGTGQPPMDHPRRIHLDVTAPRLPDALDGLLVLAGAQDPVQGFVPMGAALGMDFSDGTSQLPDHVTDPDPFNPEAGHLKMRIASRHTGLETSPWAVVTLAMPSMNLFAEEQVLTLAGTVTHVPDGFRQLDGATSPLDLSRELPVPPDNGTLDEAARTFSLPAVSGATLHRLDIGSPDKRWSIWFPAGAASFTIPPPPTGFADRFPGVIPDSSSAGILHTASLGYPPPRREHSLTYDDVWRFDGVDANNLSPETDAFSSRWLSRP